VSAIFQLAFLAAVLRITVPYALAALGGAFSERSGVINIALEGMMLAGAFFGVVGAYATHSPFGGVLCATLAGVALAAIYALLVLRFSADQIVCGVALNLLADGLTRFLLKSTFGSSSNSPRVAAAAFGAGSSTTLLSALEHPLVLATIALTLVGHVFLFHTPLGLRVRAVGEHPEAAASLGVRTRRVRLFAVLLSGALAGLGGAWLAADQRQFVAGMTNGRGYIALAAMIFGGWRPIPEPARLPVVRRGRGARDLAAGERARRARVAGADVALRAHHRAAHARPSPSGARRGPARGARPPAGVTAQRLRLPTPSAILRASARRSSSGSASNLRSPATSRQPSRPQALST
jgi:simple sugar transport system permease protein